MPLSHCPSTLLKLLGAILFSFFLVDAIFALSSAILRTALVFAVSAQGTPRYHQVLEAGVLVFLCPKRVRNNRRDSSWETIAPRALHRPN